jgi:hypothetical protein
VAASRRAAAGSSKPERAMAISFELKAHSDVTVDHVFSTIADLRSWDAFVGVVLVGPQRIIAAGDRLEVSMRVMGREIRSGCVVHLVEEPTRTQAGRVDIKSVDGPIQSRMIGMAIPNGAGCDLSVEVHGIGRGAARMLERPVELIMERWAAHQMRHLLAVAAAPQRASVIS